MESFESLLIFVACERCSCFDLSTIHCDFSTVAWATYSVHIFLCFLITLLLMIVFLLIISFRFLVRLKDIIESPIDVLAKF